MGENNREILRDRMRTMMQDISAVLRELHPGMVESNNGGETSITVFRDGADALKIEHEEVCNGIRQ